LDQILFGGVATSPVEEGINFLKNVLLFVFFLDKAKSLKTIPADPLLFEKVSDQSFQAQYPHRLVDTFSCLFPCPQDSIVKSSRGVLQEFSKLYLKGEGDLVRHLSFLGFDVPHIQSALAERVFVVKNLATDLRDGVILARLLDTCDSDCSLLQVSLPMTKNHDIASAN